MVAAVLSGIFSLSVKQKMKNLLYVALALCAMSCTSQNNLEDTLYNVVKTGSNMAIDSLSNAANKEIERHIGIDSLATKLVAVDSINVERELKRGIIKILSE